MIDGISDKHLSKLSNYISENMGLHYPKKRWGDLVRILRSIAAEFDFQDVEPFIKSTISSRLTKEKMEILACHLTIGETYFFRDKEIFKILQEQILPELLYSRKQTFKRLKLWSAGCSTGEEPYSLAILLSEMIPHIEDWSITILATDLNRNSLQKAKDGVYSDWSFRDTPPWVMKYFKKTKEGRFEIRSSIKNMVSFSRLNLVKDIYSAPLNNFDYSAPLNNFEYTDVIFCRNVLMYFDTPRIKEVAQNLYRALADGGRLFVGIAEMAHEAFYEFPRDENHDSIILKQDGSDANAVYIFPGWANDEAQSPFLPTISATRKHEPPVTPDNPFIFPPLSGTNGNKPSRPAPVKTDGEAANPFLPNFHAVPITKPEDTIAPQPEEQAAIETNVHIPEKTLQEAYEVALALNERGSYQEASNMMERLISKDGDNAQPMALLARIYANQGKLTPALEWCQRAIAIDKVSPTHRYLNAIILEELGEADQAIVSYKRAIYLDQDFVVAHFALGKIALKLRKLTEANKYFDNVLSILNLYPPDKVVPESDGLSAKRLMEIVKIMSGERGI